MGLVEEWIFFLAVDEFQVLQHHKYLEIRPLLAPLVSRSTFHGLCLNCPRPKIFFSRLVGILAPARGEYPTPRNLPSSGGRIIAEDT
jgi:hypothetical protein